MKRKEKEYLVCIIDTTSRYVRVKAKTKRGAENKINNGDWFDEDVEKEEGGAASSKSPDLSSPLSF